MPGTIFHFLQAEALGLKAGIVGAFEDMKVINVLGILKKCEPLLIMPVGYSRNRVRTFDLTL